MKHSNFDQAAAKQAISNHDFSKLYKLLENADFPEKYKKAIRRDLMESAETGVLTSANCKNLINHPESGSIYGVFSARYFPSLSVDGVEYDRLPLPSYSGMNLASPVVPIKIKNATEGFLDNTVVALFPENHLDGIQKSTDKVFYFIDKFVERHLNRTKIILDKFTTEESFAHIKSLTRDEIQEYSIHWVWLHEYFHRLGPLPLPEYLDVKSYRPLAGMEECRVDMEAVYFIFHCTNIPEEKRKKLCEFIISERILRYSVEGIPSPNYDAIGSQVLVNYLKTNGYLVINNDMLSLKDDYIDGVKKFIDAIYKIESKIVEHSRSEVKKLLVKFVNQNLNMPYESNKYEHNPFCIKVRDAILA